MTDKVQKIKNWISKEQDGLMDANGNFEYSEHEGAYHILCNLDTYIDSLQEEPVSKVWHYQKNEPVDEIADKSRPIIVVYGNNSLNAAGKFRYYEYNSDAIWLSNSYEKWAFVEDLINLTHSITKVSWKEEPVNEDLGNYINELSKQFPEVSFAKLSRIAVRVAKWQKQKDKSKVLTEEQCRKICNDAFELGKDAMKQQIMKDAVEGEIVKDIANNLYIGKAQVNKNNFKFGEKVRLLVLKEE